MVTHASFNYAVFDDGETELMGCVYLDPPEVPGPDVDAEISWWVRDEHVGSDVEVALGDFVPRWVAAEWPLERPRFGPPGAPV